MSPEPKAPPRRVKRARARTPGLAKSGAGRLCQPGAWVEAKEQPIDELVGEFGREPQGPATGPFQRLLGYRTKVSAEHGAYVELEVAERHLSQYGVAHGGVALVLLDTVGGVHLLAARPELARLATISLSANFIKPVRPGRVVATATIQRIGGAVAYTSMALHQGDFTGEILAVAHGAYRLFHAERA